ncbi:hypothetical protein EC845_1197 [Comamonas sp. BIGb0124]|nr:hypothetical protein EC845_1197 [Comamonas sp. BIGb0124]
MRPGRFAQLENRVDRAISRHVSNVIAVYQQGNSAQLRDVPGFFTEEPQYLEDGSVSTPIPHLDLLRADVPALSERDHFTFLGRRYKVAEVVPGGGGRVVVRLHSGA